MDSHELPRAIEPHYWNVVFHPSRSRIARFILGRFQHVSAMTYLPGFRAWLVYDVQWSGARLGVFSHGPALQVFIGLTSDCTLVKFDRQYGHLGLSSRLGFYCVPAIKHLLGLSCVAVTPDQLYRHLIKHGGTILNERIDAAAAAARSDAGARTAASPG